MGERKEFDPIDIDWGKIKPFSRDFPPLLKDEIQRGYISYERRVYSKATPEEIESSWENDFTDPNRHKDSKYRYLVHALSGKAARLAQLIFMLETNSIDSSQEIDLLESPMRVSERRHISCSVIDQNHNSTFASGGLILSTQGENVLKVHPEDSGTFFSDPDKDKTLNRGNLCTAPELVEQTTAGVYNEVTLTGKTDQGEVKVMGFWIKVDEHDEPIDPEVGNRIRIHAYRLGLPLIKIKEVIKGYDDESPEVFEDILDKKVWGCAVNRGGLRYVFDFKRGEFFVLENMNKSRSMTKKEFDYAKSLFSGEFNDRQMGKTDSLLAQSDEQFENQK